MKNISRVTLAALAAGVTVTCCVTACTGDNSDNTDTTSNQPATSSSATTAAERPVDVPVVPSTSHAPAIAPPPVDTRTHDAEAIYLAVLELSGTVPGTDNQKVSLGHEVCETFDAGATVTDQALVAIEEGVTSWFGLVMGAAVGSFCPEYQPALDAFQAQYS